MADMKVALLNRFQESVQGCMVGIEAGPHVRSCTWGFLSVHLRRACLDQFMGKAALFVRLQNTQSECWCQIHRRRYL